MTDIITDIAEIKNAINEGFQAGTVDHTNSAEELRRTFGVTDPRVLDAVWWHTPGHPDYPPEAWAMFIADKVEPRKAKRWKALKKVYRDALEVGVEVGALRYVELRIKQALREGYVVQPEMVTTRNALLTRIGHNADESDGSG